MKATRATPAPSQVDNTDACIAHNLAKMNTSPMSVTVGLLWERLKALEAVSKPPTLPPFVPVVVTLETQTEVDFVWALLNHGAIRTAGSGCGLDLKRGRDELQHYTHQTRPYHETIHAHIVAEGRP